MRMRVGISLDLGSIIRGGGAPRILRSVMSADCILRKNKRGSEGELGFGVHAKLSRRVAVSVAGFFLQAAAVRDALGVGMPVVGTSGDEDATTGKLLEKMEAAPAGLRRSAGSAGITQIFAGKEAKQVCHVEVYTVCVHARSARTHARTHTHSLTHSLTHSRKHAHAHTHTHTHVRARMCVCSRLHVWWCQWHARCACVEV
jgi:hypothetical protein